MKKQYIVFTYTAFMLKSVFSEKVNIKPAVLVELSLAAKRDRIITSVQIYKAKTLTIFRVI
jgi:hypothetical protein